MRNRLFREHQAKDCQDVEKLRRICCEENRSSNRSKNWWIVHASREDPTTVSQLLTEIQDLQSKVNSVSDAREFYDPETSSSSGATHVPSKPLCIHSPVSRTFFCTWRVHSHICTFSCVSHTRMAQGCQKGSLHMCHISPSRLVPSHDSPILAVP